jgi:hypothetical protein
MFRFPRVSQVPAGQRGHGEYGLRYEDIAQNGDLKLTALQPAIGAACFRPLWRTHPINVQLGPKGVLPILTGITIERTDGPVSLIENLQAEGSYQLAHDVDAAGNVSRLFLNLHATISGQRGLTHGPQPPGAGERIQVGRVFAEHAFTRPFAPAGERKVLSFDVPGEEAVPSARHRWVNAVDLLSQPPGAEALCPLSPEPSTIAFGLVHTDSNQHVNSLVYPSLFEQAVVRRATELGLKDLPLTRLVDVAYRKPCFAGDVVQLHLQLLRSGDEIGAVGYLAPVGVGPERANCTMRLSLR